MDQPASSTLFAMLVFAICEAETLPTATTRDRFTVVRENLCRLSFRLLLILAWIVLTCRLRPLRCALASFGSRSR